MLGLRGLYSAGPQKSSKPVTQIVLVASRRVSIVGPQGSKRVARRSGVASNLSKIIIFIISDFFSNFVEKIFFFQFSVKFGIGILSLYKNIDLQNWFVVLKSAAALKLEFLHEFEKSRFSKFFDFFA